jgi:Ca2+/H+ antiporter
MAKQPPKINSQKFNRRVGRLKYMQSFYEKKLDLCEEKQRGLFEDLISALKYTITFMQEMKTYADFYWSDDNAANRIEEAVEDHSDMWPEQKSEEANDDTASEEPAESIREKHAKDLEELNEDAE